MRPVCLQLKGFTSFKDETTVPFAQLDRFVVCGPTGAGKSSLFDAITFALFASAPRIDSGTKRDLHFSGKKKAFSVTLDFRVDVPMFIAVTRSRSHSRQRSDRPSCTPDWASSNRWRWSASKRFPEKSKGCWG